MTQLLKPLEDCVAAYGNHPKIRKNYDTKNQDVLLERIDDTHTKLLFDKAESDRSCALRTVLWFINAALTRKGIAPSARAQLGPIPRTARTLIEKIKKQDGPYYDLQWLAHRAPELIPAKWSEIKWLMETAPGLTNPPIADTYALSVPLYNGSSVSDSSFEAANRLIGLQTSVARKCRTLKLSPALQSQMRWLCGSTTRALIKKIDEQSSDLRRKMKLQGIKQLTTDRIDNRLEIFRSWKLAGGGSNWQVAADNYFAVTGRKISRQGVKDMIERLAEQKLIRRKRGRKKVIEPLLPLGGD